MPHDESLRDVERGVNAFLAPTTPLNISEVLEWARFWYKLLRSKQGAVVSLPLLKRLRAEIKPPDIEGPVHVISNADVPQRFPDIIAGVDNLMRTWTTLLTNRICGAICAICVKQDLWSVSGKVWRPRVIYPILVFQEDDPQSLRGICAYCLSKWVCNLCHALLPLDPEFTRLVTRKGAPYCLSCLGRLPAATKAPTYSLSETRKNRLRGAFVLPEEV